MPPWPAACACPRGIPPLNGTPSAAASAARTMPNGPHQPGAPRVASTTATCPCIPVTGQLALGPRCKQHSRPGSRALAHHLREPEPRIRPPQVAHLHRMKCAPAREVQQPRQDYRQVPPVPHRQPARRGRTHE
eukprot:1196076-Prorocentrum_minimum.AAC.3